jgi:glc operon protein GlcG
MRTLPTIDLAEAKRAVDLIVEKALQLQKAAVVAVVDSHGELIYFARMDGAPITSIRIAMNKAWTTVIRDLSDGAAEFRFGGTARLPEPSRSAAFHRRKTSP